MNETLTNLGRMSNVVANAETLSDGELAEKVTEKVWGNIPITSEASALMEEMIARFRRLAGIAAEEV